MRLAFLLAALLSSLALPAQNVSTLMGARSAGMAYASAGLADEWSVFNNPAGVSAASRPSAFFAYEVRPAPKGTNRTAAGLQTSLGWGSAALGVFRFGDEAYSEQSVSAVFGNRFGIASLGLRLSYVQYRTQGFGTAGALSLTFGGQATITDKLIAGAYMVNLNQAKLSGEERLPTLMMAGLTIRLAEDLILSTEVEKDLDYPLTWKTGAEYTFRKKFVARTGFSLWPQSGFFGVGFRKGRLRLDYSAQVGSDAGSRHMASAVYDLKRGGE